MKTEIMYDPRYLCDDADIDTTRKAGPIAESLISRPIQSVEIVSPAPATIEQVQKVHSPEYTQAIFTGEPREIANRNGLTNWSETFATSRIYATGGIISAATRAYTNARNTGSLSSGLHHANYDAGAGFCTFNGLVIAALEAMQCGAKRVLILDLDAHCGGGTARLIANIKEITQVDVSVNYFDQYQSTENATLYFADGDNYLSVVGHALDNIDLTEKFDLILYNSGMDVAGGSAVTGPTGISHEHIATREELVFAWAHTHQIPVAFVLAGGYIGPGLSIDELVDLHRLTIAAAAKYNEAAQNQQSRA